MRYILTLVALLSIGRFSNGASTVPPTTGAGTSPVPASANASSTAEIPPENLTPPPPPRCSPDKACPPLHECTGGFCFCIEGYYSSGPGNCTKFPGLGDACKEESLCYGPGVDPDCPVNGTKVCRCRVRYEPNKNKTYCELAAVMVGDACEYDLDCTAAFSFCQSGKCACIEGFKADEKKCTPTVYRCDGDDKPLEKDGSVVLCMAGMDAHVGWYYNDTCGPDHFCNYWGNTYSSKHKQAGHCCPKPTNTNITFNCPVGAENKNGTCPDMSKFPVDSPLPPEISASFCPMIGGYNYDCISGRCCPVPCQYRFNLNGRCFDRAGLHQFCEVTAQCPTGAACIDGYCHCKPGYVEIDAMISYCETVEIALGLSLGPPPPIIPIEPPPPGPLAPIGAHQIGEPLGPPIGPIAPEPPREPIVFAAKSKFGRHPPPPPPPAHLGEPCWENQEAPPALCIGEGVDRSCPLEEGKRFCVCRSGYEPSDNKTCKPAVRLVGDACITDGDCTASFSSCQSEKCACIDGFKADKDKLCVPTEYHCNNGGKPLEEGGAAKLCTVNLVSYGADHINDTCPSGHTCQIWPKSFPDRRVLAGHCCSAPANAATNITATCPVGVKHPGSCRDLSEFPADAPLPPHVLAELCPFGSEYECFEGACCPVPCRASNGHFNSNGRCYEFSYLDGPCEINAQCPVPNSECRNSTCQCLKGFKRPSDPMSSGMECEKEK